MKIKLLGCAMYWIGKREFSDSEQQNNLYQQAFSDRVYIFSPNGEVFDLPAKSTALDFAYLIHTNVGHRCKGAKINGKLTPLTQPLKTGDRVEIVTGKENQPSRDWMRKELGFLTTQHAIRKVRHWFHKLDYDENIRDGMQIWEKSGASTRPKKSGFICYCNAFQL